MEDLFWLRIENLLKAHKINQKQFAESIGIPIGTFWSWVCCNYIPDAKTACAMAQTLGVTVEYLVRGTEITG